MQLYYCALDILAEINAALNAHVPKHLNVLQLCMYKDFKHGDLIWLSVDLKDNPESVSWNIWGETSWYLIR